MEKLNNQMTWILDLSEKSSIVRIFVMKIKEQHIYNFEPFLIERGYILFNQMFSVSHDSIYLDNITKEVLHI